MDDPELKKGLTAQISSGGGNRHINSYSRMDILVHPLVGDMGQRVKRNCIRSIEMSPLMGRKSILRRTRVQVGSTNVREHYRSSFYNPAIQGYYQSWNRAQVC